MKCLLGGLILCCLFGGWHVSAATLTALSYDMVNGNGQASGGTFNYWDKTYNGAGNTMTDNALLSGGRGDLTDGVITDKNWDMIENDAGTGPYVGWRCDTNLACDPTITFRFSGVTAYEKILIHVDDSDRGGVSTPQAIMVSDGTIMETFTITDPGDQAAPFLISLDVTGLGLSGDAIAVTLKHRSIWVFADEIQFEGRTAGVAPVPEPASVTLLALGVLGLGTVARRWRRSPR